MGQQRNEGEGNRTADKQYVDATKRFIDEGKVEPAAEQAKKAVESAEGAELRKAEERPRSPATASSNARQFGSKTAKGRSPRGRPFRM